MSKWHIVSEWNFTAWRGVESWVGLAKRTPFINGHPIKEPGEVWFEIAATEEEVLKKIRCSIMKSFYA